MKGVTSWVTGLVFGALLLAGGSAGIAQKQSERDRNRRALVEMEHQFAQAAAGKGTRAAFLEFLADDGIIFQPGPVNGKQWWTQRTPRKGLLSWEPEFADVACAGDLGYTTGPWEFRPNGPNDQPVAFGHYFTIWKKQPDGSWKAVLDRGVDTSRPFATRVLQFPTADEKSGADPVDVEKARTALLKLESDFSQRATKGALAAYDQYLAERTRLLRKDQAPIVGKQAALEVISARQGTWSWQPIAADVSKSGDLGYVYGSFEFKHGATAEQGSFVRVWQRHGPNWRIVIDIASPAP